MSPQSDLTAIDLQGGSAQQLNVSPASYESVRVAPDGKRVALGTDDGHEAIIWIYDLSGASSRRRLTFGGRNRFPVWSADGARAAGTARPVVYEFRQAEVEYLHHAVRAHFHVGRLQIAVNDCLFMGRLDRTRDLPGDWKRFIERYRPCAMRSASVGPSTSSRTSARRSPDSSRP